MATWSTRFDSEDARAWKEVNIVDPKDTEGRSLELGGCAMSPLPCGWVVGVALAGKPFYPGLDS